MGLSVSITLWTAANILLNHNFSTVRPNEFFNRLAYVSGYLAVLCGLIFTYHFPIKRHARALELQLVTLLSVLSVCLAATTMVAGSVTRDSQGLDFSVGPLITLYVASVGLCILLVGRNLTHLRGASPEGRLQARFILAAFLITAPLGLVVNVIVPVFAANWTIAQYGPLASVILVATIGYAMVRHGLFDFRMLVARSMAYIGALVVLAGLFGLLVFGSMQYVFGLHVPPQAQLYISIATALAAAGFARLKKFFDSVTNSLFYADAYDAQSLFDKLNMVLVSTIDLDALLTRVTNLLAGELRVEYSLVGLNGNTKRSMRFVGSSYKPHMSTDDVALLRSLAEQYRRTVVSTDLLGRDARHERFKNLLRRNNIAVLIRLAPESSHGAEDIGYLMLGAKKSGSPYTVQDFRVLETVANELIIATQNSLHFEQIKSFNETLQGKVSQATNELRRTNEKLKTLDATKDEFISMASHQLRTPLTSVKGYLSMVLEGDVGPINDQQRQMLEQSYNSSQRMVYLISDLLNLSRLNTGKFVIESTSVDLSEVVQGEVEQLAETAKSRNLTLTYKRPSKFPRLMLDETKIHQVVMNLIDNAIYYTPSGGTVTVALRETPTAVEYTVTDTGIGVPKAVQHKLFSKFYRARNAQSVRPDGTGLGLFMAKKVVVAQDGAMIFESAEGKGSTFGFRFSKSDHLVPTTPTGAQEPVLAAVGQ